MSLSKVDVINKKFVKRFRGYDRFEVESFLNECADVLGSLAEDKMRMEQRIEHLEQTLGEHKRREETLRDTLMTTQRMVDELKANARKEGQLIIQDAQGKAEAILNQAHMRLAQIHEDITELKRQRTQFEVKLKGILDAHTQMLEMENQEHEELDSLESKLKFFKKTS